MEINLTGVQAAENQVNTTSTFKKVEKGLHTLTISKLEEAKRGDKTVLRVTFDSKEAEASFNHDFFLTEKALPRVQYLISKFTGNPLEGSLSIAALSAILVGKTKTVVVDAEIRPREKDGKWYNNEYATLRFAGFVEPEGDDATPRLDERQKMNLDVVNNPELTGVESKPESDLPF